jgi:hypothetical protein
MKLCFFIDIFEKGIIVLPIKVCTMLGSFENGAMAI